MPIQTICPIEGIEKLNDHAYAFTLDAIDIVGLITEPGMFVHVKCGEGLLLRRPISICGWDDEGKLRIVFEVRGEGTDWLAKRQVGEDLNVIGPLGHGFTFSEEERPLVVGGGIGVPPMLGCAKAVEGRATAVVGFRSADRAMLVEEFEVACKAVYVCSDDGSIGEKGFADGQVRRALTEDKTITSVHACGPKPMIRAIVKVAEEFNIPCFVSLEERMACGVGACLGCAVQMADGHIKHVCKDGPVFSAQEVDWNV